MDSQRRYKEHEVEEILRRATDVSETRDGALAPVEGVTLSDLRDIGREVGIDPDAISKAAASLEHRAPQAPATRTFLGTPIGVGRTVYYDRPLTEAEWHRLVVDLRETFQARGKVREEGAFRQWTNSNLQALLEPTDSGERLSLSTLKGDAKALIGAGFGMLTVVPLFMVLGTLFGFNDSATLASAVTWAVAGGLLYTMQRFRLPRWAATREQQMEGIVSRLTAGMEGSDSAD